MVITPESLSLHNAFVFLKTAVLRYVWRETGKEEFLAALHSTWLEAISHPEKVNIRTSIESIRKWDRYSAFVVRGLIDELKIKFVVNKYRDSSEDIHIRSFSRAPAETPLLEKQSHLPGCSPLRPKGAPFDTGD